MIKYLLSTILIFGALQLNAQKNKYFDDIKKTFDKKGQSQLEKIDKALTVAEKNFSEGEKLYSSKNLSKAVTKAKSASGSFNTQYRELYTLYYDKLNSVIKNAEGKQKTYFEKKLQDAKNYYRVAIYNRLKAGEVKDFKEAYELYKAAHQNEVLSIDVLSRIFAVINGWETTDYNVEEETYNVNESFANSDTQNYNGRNFSVNNPELLTKYKINTQHFIADNNNDLTDNNNNQNYSNYTNSNKFDNTNNNNYSGEVKEHEFRIQIGTSILPASQNQLKRLNSTNLPVSTYKSKIYYKYTIGSFNDFQEAKNFKNAYGLSKTYIVEYKNGKEVKFYYKDY